MFRVMRFGDSKKSIYEVSELDRARMLAREYSRSLSRWMAEKSCNVEIRDTNGIVVDTVNAFR
jgi:hypothetical protein